MRPHQFALLLVVALMAVAAMWWPTAAGVIALSITGYLCLDETRFTRGPGSWRTDRTLTILAGVCWGVAMVLTIHAIMEALT